MADDVALSGSDWPDANQKEAQMLQCCVCQSQVKDSAWLLACLHVCCDQCALLSSATPRAAESDGVDNHDNEQPLGQIKKNGRSISCARCQENAQILMSATGAFLNVIEVANRSAAPSLAACLANDLPPADQRGSASSLVSELQQQQQSSQLFCLTCDTPCDVLLVDEENACLQLEHDVRAMRDPRVTKRLSRLLDDAQRARQRLLDERKDLTTASDASAQLDAKLRSMQNKHNEELLEAKRRLSDIIEQSYLRASKELRTCSDAYKEKAERALTDTCRVREHADYALRFSEIILASASSSPNVLCSIPEILKCFQQHLHPLAAKCRVAHDWLAAAAVNPESAVYLERQAPSNVDELIANFIGHPKLRVGKASTNSSRRMSCTSIPALTYSRDLLLSIRNDVIRAQYCPAALIKDIERTLLQSDLCFFSYSASNSSNQNEKPDVMSQSESFSLDNFRSKNEVTKAITDLPDSSSFAAASQQHLVKAAEYSLDCASRSSLEAADHERESTSSNFSYSAKSQGNPFESISGSESHHNMPLWRDHQQIFMQVNSSKSLAKFQLSHKCWDIAIAEDRNAVFAAAYHDGMREFSFDGKELSSWQTESPPVNSWRTGETGTFSSVRGRSDTVYTVDTLNDGRVIVGLFSCSVAVLRRVLTSQETMLGNDICGATGAAWLEDGERVPLGSRPWRLASDGVDLVAVIHTSHGAKAQPGTSFDLVSVSKRAVVHHYRFSFAVSSVAIADGESIFVASFPMVDTTVAYNERRMQFTIVQLDLAGNYLWQKNFQDNLFDIACPPSTPELYLALGHSRRIVAVSRHDGSEVAQLLPQWHDAPVRLSLRRSSERNMFFTILRYDLRSIEVYSN